MLRSVDSLTPSFKHDIESFIECFSSKNNNRSLQPKHGQRKTKKMIKRIIEKKETMMNKRIARNYRILTLLESHTGFKESPPRFW